MGRDDETLCCCVPLKLGMILLIILQLIGILLGTLNLEPVTFLLVPRPIFLIVALVCMPQNAGI